MARRWKWFLRRGRVVIDLTGQAIPDGDVPGRFRRLVVEDLVPDLRVTSRCDGALVYERPEERPEVPLGTNQRAGGYPPHPPGERDPGRSPAPPDEPAAAAWQHPPERAAATRVPVTPRVAVFPGDVVSLGASDYLYADGGPLRLRIVRVRLDISQWYGGLWVWLEGVEIGPDNQDGGYRRVLAKVAALSRAEA